MNEKEQLIEVLDKAIKKYDAIMDSYNKRKYEIYEESNAGLPPTIDSMGRLHAPCDGYLFNTNDGRDEIYNKGEFLPEPESLEDMYFGKPETRQKIKTKRIFILETQKQDFKDLAEKASDQLTVSFSSSSWYDQKLDDKCTYVYIGGNASNLFYNDFIQMQDELMADLKKKVKDALSPLEDQKEATIQGVIVGIRLVEDNYAPSYGQPVFKQECLIKLEQGNILSGTLSKKMQEVIPEDQESVDFLIGKKIEMVAEIRSQKSDNTKGYYKSPKKIVIKDENDLVLGKKKEVKRKIKMS